MNTESIDSTSPLAPGTNRSIVKTSLVLIPLFLIALLAWKVSILSIGRAGEGHTAIVWKSNPYTELHFIDSATAACKRRSPELLAQARRDAAPIPGVARNPYAPSIGYSDISWACEGGLAISLLDNPLKLARLPYMHWIKNFAE